MWPPPPPSSFQSTTWPDAATDGARESGGGVVTALKWKGALLSADESQEIGKAQEANLIIYECVLMRSMHLQREGWGVEGGGSTILLTALLHF